MSHWTYCSAGQYDDLQQGDIIGRDDGLLEILKGAHEYFCADRYLAFLVVTQTCDLVRREGQKCKASYISLAVVRELDQVLPNIVQELSGSKHKPILIRERKRNAEEFLERLVDQNEQARGLFYLHPEGDAGIATASVAFLRITITLRRDHYDVLTRCRVGRLKPEFSNKLGWLVGNLYSRIGTPDWDEKDAKGRGKALAIDYLSDAAPPGMWVPSACIAAAERNNVDFASLEGQPASALLQYSPPPALDVFIDELHATAITLRFEAIKDQMKERMRADSALMDLVICDVVSRFSDAMENTKLIIASSLRDSDLFATQAVNCLSSIVKRATKIKGPDSFARAVDEARETNEANPPVIRVAQEVVSEAIGQSPEDTQRRLSGAPFFRSQTLDCIANILKSLGSEQHSHDLESLKARLRNNTRLKTLSKLVASQQ